MDLDPNKYRGDGGIEDIVRAKLTEDWEALTESSVRRIGHHVADGHFGIVTSWRGGTKGMSKENVAQKRKYLKNHAQFKDFRKTLNKHGFGYVRMVGHGALEKGADASSYREHSVFIPGKGKHTPLTKDHMHSYANKYKQESYIYSGPETNHEVHLFDSKTGKSTMHFGKFNANHLGDYHSRLLSGSDTGKTAKETGRAGKAFAFESEIIAWEYLPERTLSSMRAWGLTEKKIAVEEGLDLEPTLKRIEEKLQIRHDELFEDDDEEGIDDAD